MPDIDWKNIERQTASLAQTILGGFVQQATKDAQAFRVRAEQQIAGWLQELRDGEITKKNFESLVRGERDLAEMHALKQAGLAHAALDAFTSGFMEIVLTAALAAI
jgi:hypothetical protein